jgi:hypothetical protein
MFGNGKQAVMAHSTAGGSSKQNRLRSADESTEILMQRSKARLLRMESCAFSNSDVLGIDWLHGRM